MKNSIVEAAILEKALAQAKGSYQKGLILGEYRLSGADLRGSAKNYSGSYARSRRALIKRLWNADITVREAVLQRRGRRVLVLGNATFEEIESLCGPVRAVNFLFA